MIYFGVWAPSEQVFWQSWIDAGICNEQRVFAQGYAGYIDISDQTVQGWIPTRDGVVIPGWHANIRVWGALEAEFTYGRPQTGSVWDRTWAKEIFLLQEQPASEETGFPAGYRNSVGVTYTDSTDFTNPRNVWA